MNHLTTRPDGDALDVLVIGAGQSGLAIGYHLAQQRARFVIVDAAPSLGHAWRTRWDSLRLFSPARYDGLPGMEFPAAPDTYPTKDQVADYLTSYADRFQLPVLLGHAVSRLTHDPDARRARFTVHTNQGPLRARQVVVATGAFQRPRVPAVAARFADAVTRLHSADYRNPDQLPDGPVLVVGAGNSGLQIAEELAVHARRTTEATPAAVTPAGASSEKLTAGRRVVHLAVGSSPTQLPQRVLGRDLFWWLTRTGAINKPATSAVARRFRARSDLVIGTSRKRVAELGVVLRPRVVDATPAGAVFDDGTRLQPTSVVWATGFCPDYSWIDIPGALVRDGDGEHPAHERGVSPVSGLYFLGMPWQHTRGSALLGFVGQDAAWLADRFRDATL